MQYDMIGFSIFIFSILGLAILMYLDEKGSKRIARHHKESNQKFQKLMQDYEEYDKVFKEDIKEIRDMITKMKGKV